MLRLYCMLFAWMVVADLKAQVRVHVITKTIEQSFPLQKGESVHIQGEKSNVQVHTWDQSTVKVLIKLHSKSQNQDLAERELKYQKYICEKIKETVHVKNYFLVPKGRQLSSLLQADYELWIPSDINLIVENNYGNVTIDEKAGYTQVDFRYGTLKLDGPAGRTNIKGYFGDLIVSKLYGDFKADLKHTTSVLNRVIGTGDIKTSLGDVTVGTLEATSKLEIDASKSDVNLNAIEPNGHRFRLRSEYGEILIPPEFPAKVEYVSGDLNLLEYGDKTDAEVNIKTTFGNIILELK